MKTDQLITQIETYSNAIVGFVALQAITYSVSFGTSEFFNCSIKTARFLAHGITAHFALATVLACVAILALGRQIQRVSDENRRAIRRIYLGKCIAVVLFTSLPIGVTLFYGVLDYPSKYDCKAPKKAA